MAAPNRANGKMQIVYHGTDEATAKKILKNGFKPDTFFATHLEHALGYGGKYIFEVAIESDIIPKVPDWEFVGTPTVPSSQTNSQYWEFVSADIIPPSHIVSLKQYPAAKTITENKALRNIVFQSKSPKAKTEPRIELSPEQRPRTSRLNTQPHGVGMPSKQRNYKLLREPRGKIVTGVGYVDKGSRRLSRKHRRGFKKVRYT